MPLLWCANLWCCRRRQAVRCAVGLSVTKTNLYDPPPLTQAHNSLYQAASLFKGLVGTVANNIHTLANSTGDYPGAYASTYGYDPPSVHGRKRGFLWGVSYRGKRYMLKLRGSVNDLRCMRYSRVGKMGF
ncbi:uncharacterized protein J3R85_005004 [Psidium guajava]|nr:uncharacterized protein J3R85_005004 [Psidium guajava]